VTNINIPEFKLVNAFCRNRRTLDIGMDIYVKRSLETEEGNYFSWHK
jgi:hypothetical protein